MTTILTQRIDFHRTVLIEKVTRFNPQALQHLQAYSGLLQDHGASGHDAAHGALAMLQGQVLQQASVLSYEDANWLVGALLCFSLTLLFLLNSGRQTRRPAMEH